MATETSYEEIPYESLPLHQTHPDCLATAAFLLGMEPARVARCRVLELGCAAGGNLIPMAECLPDSRFVGIDLSQRQIADGQKLVAALGLINLELRAMSILDVDAALGQFDYIICHGVYSWVPDAVRDKILEICARNLAPSGVAYVSYNTYPGWYKRQPVREMMRFAVRNIPDSRLQVQKARALLEFLLHAVPEPDGTYGRLLKDEALKLRSLPDSYVFHEHLEEENHPVYFHEFVAHAGAHKLKYLREATSQTALEEFPPEVQKMLWRLAPDLIELEQYLDFLRNRMLRRTLLCHQDVAIARNPAPKRVAGLHLSALARPVAKQPVVASIGAESFRTETSGITTDVPLIKAVLVALYQSFPSALDLDTLGAQVRAFFADPRLPKPLPEGEAGRRVLAEVVLECYQSSLLSLHVHPPRFAGTLSERPTASPLARHLARRGPQVTNLRHRTVGLNELDRALVPLLDGERDQAALIDALVAAATTGALSIPSADKPVRDEASVRPLVEAELPHALARILGNSLII